MFKNKTTTTSKNDEKVFFGNLEGLGNAGKLSKIALKNFYCRNELKGNGTQWHYQQFKQFSKSNLIIIFCLILNEDVIIYFSHPNVMHSWIFMKISCRPNCVNCNIIKTIIPRTLTLFLNFNRMMLFCLNNQHYFYSDIEKFCI